VTSSELHTTSAAVPDASLVASESVEDVPLLDSRRRYTVVSAWAAGLVALPYLWILWFQWGSPSLLRHTPYEDNFYDLQARAMLSGRLSVPHGSLGIEGFFHAGREYTYFGIFPSIIRLPILLVAHIDGRLDSPSLLVAWLLTALVVPLLLWRVRGLVRGSAALGRSEAGAYGVLVAASLGGTVLLQLAANPFVFSEDLAWSVCLAFAGFFLLLGILERPTRRQTWLALVVVLAANLNRVTTGWALAGAAILIAGYFAMGRGGEEKKRWSLWVLAVGLIPLAVASAVNYAKFGMLFGVSNFAQEFTHVNAYRREFLAANHNSESGTIFIPTALLTYLRPDGINLSSAFPFVTLPTAPPTALGGVLFDRLYRTASIPASMPLAFLLGCWGAVTAFRPRSVGRVHLMRILLLATAGSGALLFGWGYIAERYLADFVPFFVLAAAVGMADLWRRLEGRSPGVRRSVLVVVAALGAFSIVANIGIAVTPNEEWTANQALHFVQTQKAVANATGVSLRGSVHRGATLPVWAPAGQLFVVGECAGLYVSNGERYGTVPAQQYTRTTWLTVERGMPFLHAFAVRFQPASSVTYTDLVSTGPDSFSVSSRPSVTPAKADVLFVITKAHGYRASLALSVAVGSLHRIDVITDAAKQVEEMSMDGVVYVSDTLTGSGIIELHVASGDQAPPGVPMNLSVLPENAPVCRSLVGR
jgi:hypothetical protein